MIKVILTCFMLIMNNNGFKVKTKMLMRLTRWLFFCVHNTSDTPENYSYTTLKEWSSISFAGEANPGRRLIIIRTYNEGGREFVRKETVQNQFVIDAYLRIVTKEKNYREVCNLLFKKSWYAFKSVWIWVDWNFNHLPKIT